MNINRYKNITLTDNIKDANFVTHSGNFHVDDIMSTIFLSKVFDKIDLIRLPSTQNVDVSNKLVYDIGYGEFDHHQKNRNGKRENGIYYSSIGLLWQRFGKKYLESKDVKYVEKTFEYMDKELIQYIDATDNLQMEYLENKTSPDFVKYCNPEWNEDISENDAFIKALKIADDFWEVYIKHAIAEVEAIEIILDKAKKCNDNYLTFDIDLPYRKAVNLLEDKIKYIVFKSRREGYDIRAIKNNKFNDEIIQNENENLKQIDLIYADNRGKLCCTKTLEGAIRLIELNEKINR